MDRAIKAINSKKVTFCPGCDRPWDGASMCSTCFPKVLTLKERFWAWVMSIRDVWVKTVNRWLNSWDRPHTPSIPTTQPTRQTPPSPRRVRQASQHMMPPLPSMKIKGDGVQVVIITINTHEE